MKTKWRVLTVGAWLSGAVAFAGQVINVDFQPGPLGDAYSVNYVGQGAYPDPGNDLWNPVAPDTDGSFTNFGSGGVLNFSSDPFVVNSLMTSSGTVSTVNVEVFRGVPGFAFALDPANGNDVNVADDAKSLMRDYLGTGGVNYNAVNITGLTPYGLYTLYLYGAADNGAGAEFMVNSAIKATAGVPGGAHNLTEGQDYVIFEGVNAGPTGFISIQYRNNGESYDGNICGFQLIEAEPVAIHAASISGVMGLTFLSESNAVYRLQSTTNLMSGDWVTTPVIYQGNGAPMAAFDPTGFSTSKAYRVFQQ